MIDAISPWISDNWSLLLRLLLLLLLGLPGIRLLARAAQRAAGKRGSEQAAMLAGKGTRYGLTALLLLMALHEMGFKLTALLGAAGVATVAIGFASQTSLSNLISGIFLIWEKPFQVGDALQVGEHMGLVYSIDPLSLKLRTFDNRYVRIPNESLVKNTFVNITRFPIRRLNLDLGVAYKEDIGRVMEILKEIAADNPHCLDEPAPLVIFTGFGDSAIQLMLGVWFQKTDMLTLRNSILLAIKQRFDAEGIEIPFPHRSLYSGSAGKPFPIRIVPPETAGQREDSAE